MLECLCKSFISNYNKISLCIDNEKYTYGDIWNLSNKIFSCLKSYNLPENSLIGIMTKNNIETYASIIAIWRAGHAYLPINPEYPDARIKYILQNSKVPLVIGNINTNLKLPHNIKTIPYDEFNLFSTENILYEKRKPDSLMYVLYTSGSTGLPKGVKISYENLSTFVENIESEEYDFSANDKWLQMFDFSFDVSIASFLLPWLKGAQIVSLAHKKFKHLEVIKSIKNDKINIAFLVPSTISIISNYLSNESFPHLRYTFFTGEALNVKIVNLWQKIAKNSIIENYYGPTEGTIEYTHYRISIDSKIKELNGIVCIGKPIGKEKIFIIPEINHNTGELVLCGKQISLGYIEQYNSENNPFFINEKKEVCYKTGDICYIDDQNDLFFCSRNDHLIKKHGYRINPSEIEYSASEYNKYVKFVVIPISKNNLQQIAMFYSGEKLNENSLKQFLIKRLPSYMLPDYFIYVENFPLTESGKTDINKLKESISL